MARIARSRQPCCGELVGMGRRAGRAAATAAHQRGSVMRRLIVLVSLIATMALAAVTWTALPAGAYGGGANHDMWQVGLSFNCNNPSICNTPEFGGTGGLWGWAEFDRSADGTQTWGDAEFAFCFHTVGG